MILMGSKRLSLHPPTSVQPASRATTPLLVYSGLMLLFNFIMNNVPPVTVILFIIQLTRNTKLESRNISNVLE